MAIYKLDYVNDEVASSIIENIEPTSFGYLYGLPNGDSVYLTQEFTKYQSEIWVDKYLEAMTAEYNSAAEN